MKHHVVRHAVDFVLGLALASQTMAAPVTYMIDESHSFSRFSYNHLGLSTQQSRFNKNNGKIVFDAAAQTGSVEVTIDAKSIDTGFAAFNQHIQGEDFLDTAKFPTATFKSSKVEFLNDKPAKIFGDLTIKGVTKPVVLEVTSFQATIHPMRRKDAIGANAFTTIKRSEFNAGKYVPAVSDEVRIDLAIEALRD
jgi:polyisoprenoid-binding protein YceI